MTEQGKGVRISGSVIGSNVGTRGRARVGDVTVHVGDRTDLLRRLDELRASLVAADAKESTIEVVDDLRAEARKPQPSRDVTTHLFGKLADRGLADSIKELTEAFDAL